MKMTTTATRRSARRNRFRPADGRLDTLEARCLLSGFGEDFDEVMEELRDSPIELAALPGPLGPQSGPVGHGSGAGANVNTDTTDAYSNETTIAVNPRDPHNFIAGANDSQFTVDDQGNVFETGLTRAHVTLDGGRTWTTYAIPNPAGYTANSDPAVAFDADGRAYIATLGYDWYAPVIVPDVVVSTSTDQGRTWTTPATLAVGSFTEAGVVLNDKEYIAAWGHGNAIVAWSQIIYDDQFNFVGEPVVASVTHDGGQSWSDPVQISGNLAFGAVPVVAKDGSIYVTFFIGDYETAPNYRDSYAVVKVDPDTGQPLGQPTVLGLLYDGVYDFPRNVDGRYTLQDSQFRNLPLGNITADPTNADHLAVVWYDTRNNPYPDAILPSLNPYEIQTNADVIVTQTFDGGLTWTAPAAIALPGDQFFPWSAYDETGRLQIGFHDRSYDPANHAYGYTIASEVHRGQLDFAFQQVSTTLSDPTQGSLWYRTTADPDFPDAATFIGDYSGIAVVPGRRVAAVWTDMREQATFLGLTGASQDAYFGMVKTVPSAFRENPANSATEIDSLIAILAPDNGLGPKSLFGSKDKKHKTRP